MQKYVIVSFLEKVEDGFEFPKTEWPLHVTIASNFIVDLNANLMRKIADVISTQKPITTKTMQDDDFGSQKQIKVTIVDMSTGIKSLHSDLVALLRSEDAVFDEPQYLDEGYTAHVTVQKHARVENDMPFTVSELSIVDMFPDQNIYRRKILKTFRIGGRGGRRA